MVGECSGSGKSVSVARVYDGHQMGAKSGEQFGLGVVSPIPIIPPP